MQVIKPFTTRLRRMKPGAEIAPDEDLAPHALEDLIAAGFVGEPASAAPPTAAEEPPAAHPHDPAA